MNIFGVCPGDSQLMPIFVKFLHNNELQAQIACLISKLEAEMQWVVFYFRFKR